MLRIIANKAKYTDGCLCFDDLALENVKIIKINKIEVLFQGLRMMIFDNIINKRSFRHRSQEENQGNSITKTKYLCNDQL